MSKAEGISLNQAAQQLLRRGAGLERTGNPRAIGSGLDDLIGTWSLEEARELDQAVQDFETVDEEMWR